MVKTKKVNVNGISDQVALDSRHVFMFAGRALSFLRESNLFSVCRVRKIFLNFSLTVEVDCRKKGT